MSKEKYVARETQHKLIIICFIMINIQLAYTLQWRNNERDAVSNHQPHACLLNRLLRRRSQKTSKLRVTGLCAGNLPMTGEFLAQRVSNAENVSIWWRHHVFPYQTRTGNMEFTMSFPVLTPPYQICCALEFVFLDKWIISLWRVPHWWSSRLTTKE